VRIVCFATGHTKPITFSVSVNIASALYYEIICCNILAQSHISVHSKTVMMLHEIMVTQCASRVLHALVAGNTASASGGVCW
jgi:hypothetical protein